MSLRRTSLLVGAALSVWGLPQARAQQADDMPGPIRGPKAVEGRSRQVTAEEADAIDEADAAREKPEAAAVPKVLLLPVPPLSGEVSARQADELTEMLSGALDGADLESVPWQAPASTAADASLAAATTALAGAETFWTQGQEAAKAARWSQAATAYAAGVALFRQHWAGATDLAPLVDGLLQLAEARRQLGEDDQVDPLLEEAIRLDGRRQPAAPDFDPALVARYTALRQTRMGGARAALEVNAAREGVEVVVDGRSVGRTPLRVSGLLPGQHLVQWKVDGQLVGAQIVQATAEGKATAMLAVGDGPLVRLGKALESNRIDPELVKLVRPLGTTAGADYVLFTAARLDLEDDERFEVKGFALRVTDGALAPLVRLVVRTDLLGTGGEIVKYQNALAAVGGGFRGVQVSKALELWDEVGDRSSSSARVSWNEARWEDGASAPGDSSKTEKSGRLVLKLPGAKAAETAAEEDSSETESADEQAADEQAEEGDEKVDLAPSKQKLADRERDRRLSTPVPAVRGPLLSDRILLWTGIGVGSAAVVGGLLYWLLPRYTTRSAIQIYWEP